MALTYNDRMAEVMEHLVTHSAHGYSQPNRSGDGTVETLTLSDGTVTTVHGGDYDCSEAVRMCCVAAGVLPRGCYMWTGNEVALLTGHGFRSYDPLVEKARPGDVLWRNGHTEMVMVIDDTKVQGGFRISEHRSTNGTKGDQTGWESTYSAYVPTRWTRLLRYEGAQPTGAATSAVTDASVSMEVPAGRYECVVSALNVRTGPGTGYASVAKYAKGQSVTLDGTATVADGCVWGRYVGGTSGKHRYVAVRTTGGMEYMRRTGSAQAAPASASPSVPAGTYRIVASALNVRSGAGTGYARVAQYGKGQTVRLDGWSATADGCVWGRYTGGSGKKRYIAVRTTGGTVYAERV